MRNKLIKNKHGTLIEIDREIKQERKRMKKPKTYEQGYKDGLLAYKHR